MWPAIGSKSNSYVLILKYCFAVQLIMSKTQKIHV